MIKEKLMLCNDYSYINKSCFSCRQFTHTIEECPKLHFVPSIEKIIKQHTFPTKNPRASFTRKKKKTENAFKYILQCNKAFKKVTLLARKTFAFEDSDSSNDTGSVREKLDNIDEDELKKKDEDLNKPDFYFIIPSKTEVSKNSKEGGSVNSFEGADPIYSSSKMIQIQKSMEYPSMKNMPPSNNNNNNNINNNINNNDNNNININNNSVVNTQLTAEAWRTGSKDLEIDKMCSFQIYFPNFNIEKIIANFNKTKMLTRIINRNYILTKYSNFKSYTFYVNPILERFLKETKIKNKNRRNSNGKTPNKKIDQLRRLRRSVCFVDANNVRSPLQKKSFFGKAENTKQISNFADLINTLIVQNQQKKTERKMSKD